MAGGGIGGVQQGGGNMFGGSTSTSNVGSRPDFTPPQTGGFTITPNPMAGVSGDGTTPSVTAGYTGFGAGEDANWYGNQPSYTTPSNPNAPSSTVGMSNPANPTVQNPPPSQQFYQPIYQQQYQNYNTTNPFSVSQYGQQGGFGGYGGFGGGMSGYGGFGGGMGNPFSMSNPFSMGGYGGGMGGFGGGMGGYGQQGGFGGGMGGYGGGMGGYGGYGGYGGGMGGYGGYGGGGGRQFGGRMGGMRGGIGGMPQQPQQAQVENIMAQQPSSTGLSTTSVSPSQEAAIRAQLGGGMRGTGMHRDPISQQQFAALQQAQTGQSYTPMTPTEMGTPAQPASIDQAIGRSIGGGGVFLGPAQSDLSSQANDLRSNLFSGHSIGYQQPRVMNIAAQQPQDQMQYAMAKGGIASLKR